MAIGFVIMPFGDGFDDIYKEVYAPVIKAAGLEPLRADEIYDNQPIIQDINHSIHSAKVILADVTGRNPNVNYELGAAHALGKEVIIITAKSEDVPSDYRHIRYIKYNRGDIDWNRKLSEAISKTLQTVLARLSQIEDEGNLVQPAFALDEESSQEYALKENIDEDVYCIEKAKAEGYEHSFFDPVKEHLVYANSRVELSVREGACDEWVAAIAYLLNESIKMLAERLPHGHYLKMRWVAIDNHASHGFGIDYIYNIGSLPIFTEHELDDMLYKDFNGQVFNPVVRYLEEDTKCREFQPNSEKYYTLNILPQERNPVAWRNGCYISEIVDVFEYEKGGHCFYRLKGLLPTGNIDADSYVNRESHWLADWGQTEPRCTEGDVVSFKLQKVYPLANRGHVSNARSINFSELKKIVD